MLLLHRWLVCLKLVWSQERCDPSGVDSVGHGLSKAAALDGTIRRSRPRLFGTRGHWASNGKLKGVVVVWCCSVNFAISVVFICCLLVSFGLPRRQMQWPLQYLCAVGHAMCAEDVCAGEVATSDPWYLWKRVVHGEISMAIWQKGIQSAVLIFVERWINLL